MPEASEDGVNEPVPELDPADEAIERAIKGGFTMTSQGERHKRWWWCGRHHRDGVGPPDYIQALADRKIKRNKFQQAVQRLSEWAAKQNMMAAVTLAVGLGIFFGFSTGCNGYLSWYSACHKEIFDELHKPILIEAGLDPGHSTKTHVERDITFGPSFNGGVFSGWLFLAAFVLAFTRWQIGNAQAAMTEIFQRKRDSNLFMVSNPKTQPLVENVIKTGTARRRKKTTFSEAECRDLFKKFKDDRPFGAQSTQFDQHIFVYMELDNLEFAHMKYLAGYLAPEQMYRACEIFESRCQSAFFRFIAVNHGLRFYTASFHDLVVATIIFGYAASIENDG